MFDHLRFSCLDQHVQIQCGIPSVMQLLRRNFEAMARSDASEGILYTISANDEGRMNLQRTGGGVPLSVANTGELLFALESDLAVQLQFRQPQQLFLHAAVLTRHGGAHLLVGRSGAGKSTTCWGLVRSGFEYMSDELAPVNIGVMRVAAYPHAICLKAKPPSEFPLPDSALMTERGYHIPASDTYKVSSGGDVPLRSVFVIEYDAGHEPAAMERLAPPEAAARLYPNVLNALAHENAGLKAVTNIAAACDSWRVCFSSLGHVVEGIERTIEPD
jgi:hypothetical protein